MAGLDRRSFFGLAGATALGAAAGAVRARQDAQGIVPRSAIKKALKVGMIQVEGDLRERFMAARDAGFEGVEMDSPNELQLDEVLAAKEASGLEIPGVVDSVHWRKTLGDPDPAVRAEGRAGLETALRDAHAYGASTVLLVPAVVSPSIDYASAYTRSQVEVRAVLPLAAELGVKIAFENVWNHFLLSPLEAARYVDELESDHVGWYLDVGNLVNYGWPEQWVRILGQRILKLDVKEFSRARRDDEGLWKGFDVEIGDGDCNWPAVMKALDEIGFTGWASAEVRGGDGIRLREISHRMDQVLQAR